MSTIIEIRNSAVDLLKAANIASGRIGNSNISPVQVAKTPDIRVFSDSVQATNFSPAMPAFSASMNLQIDVVVSRSNTWADDADTLVAQVIDTLFSNEDWVSQFTEIVGYDVTYSFYGDGESPLAIASIKIAAKVFKAY